MTHVLRLSLIISVVAILASCSGNSQQVAAPVATLDKKPNKKCATCPYYLFQWYDSLVVVDPTTSPPAKVGGVQRPSVYYELGRRGNYAYALGYDASLVVLNFSDGNNPTTYEIGEQAEVGYLWNVQIIGDRLCAQFAQDDRGRAVGVFSYDLADPGHPTPIGSVMFPPIPPWPVFDTKHLVTAPQSTQSKKPNKKCATCPYYVLARSDRLMLIDPRRTAPDVIATVPLEVSVYTMGRSDDYVYSEYYNGRFVVIDLSDPDHPTETNLEYWEVLNAGNWQFIGNHLYGQYSGEYSHSPTGIVSFDVTDPAHPGPAQFAIFPPYVDPGP